MFSLASKVERKGSCSPFEKKVFSKNPRSITYFSSLYSSFLAFPPKVNSPSQDTKKLFEFWKDFYAVLFSFWKESIFEKSKLQYLFFKSVQLFFWLFPPKVNSPSQDKKNFLNFGKIFMQSCSPFEKKVFFKNPSSNTYFSSLYRGKK